METPHPPIAGARVGPIR